MKQVASLALAFAFAVTAHAQTQQTFTDPANLAGERPSPITGYELPIDPGSPSNNALALQQLLRKLQTRASILNIVAHPDDEDGGMLTLNARGLGARVADLSLTRGEGGQNAMTGDFEDALGLLRTQELLANDRYTGVSQMFGTEVDFGFSKTKSEAFAKWTHERVLYDAVRAIRIFRPLVITATFIGEPTDGHGQHQVSGEIAQEAFIAAGDPNVFPELTREGILPWQPLKMYARVPMGAITAQGLYDYATNQYVPARFTNYITHQTSATPPSTDILIHEGTPDPLLTTCAANPNDLPPSLSSSLTPQSPSSRPESASSADGAERSPHSDCRPLSYIQFARLGLGLQKSQIGPGFREARPGPFDVPYHLYGSCLPSAASGRLSSDLEKICHPERSLAASSRGEVQGPAQPPTSANPLAPSSLQSQPTFFSGIDTSLQSLAQYPTIPSAPLTNLAADIDSAAANFNPAHPEASAPVLADALDIVTNLIRLTDASSASALDKANALHELRIKQTQLNQALILSLGLTLDATSNKPDQVSGDRFNVWLKLSTAAADLTLNAETVTNSIGATFTPAPLDDNRNDLTPDHAIQRNIKLEPSVTLNITRPYFTRDSIETPVYKLLSPELRNAPSTPPALTAWADIDYRGETIHLGRVLHAGQQPVSIVPPASIALSTHAQVLPNAQSTFTVGMTEASSTPVASESLGAPGWTGLALPQSASAPGRSDWQIKAPAGARSDTTLQARLRLKTGNIYTEGFRPIGYGSLPRTNDYTPATDRIVPVDLKIPTHLRLAYLPGTGDAVPQALTSIGLTPTILKVSDLTPANLAHYDTVILGVRTYNAHPDLHGAPTQSLLDFARQGGNVLVQYQTPEFTAADAPYPLSLGENAKVVDETAPVQLLTPTHPGPSALGPWPWTLGPGPWTLLTTPNRITPHDFDTWIEERGHGFLESWDSHYTALTETHDPGAPEEGVKPQSPQRGGLLTTNLGKGRWTYCAFALYRQLPEANPGAFRLFINLITPPSPH